MVRVIIYAAVRYKLCMYFSYATAYTTITDLKQYRMIKSTVMYQFMSILPNSYTTMLIKQENMSKFHLITTHQDGLFVKKLQLILHAYRTDHDNIT